MRRLLATLVAAAAATERFTLSIDVDGEPRPLGFLRGDDVDAVARTWAAANPVAGDAVAALAAQMRATLDATPIKGGEQLGCPALADGYATPDSAMGDVARRAAVVAGPAGRIVLTMATGGYADCALSWARGLERAGVKTYLVAALDDVALQRLAPLGTHVARIPAGETAPGRAAPASYGSSEFRALTAIKPALVRAVLLEGLAVLYADADVAFLQDPGPHLIYEGCSVALQPNRGEEPDVFGAIMALDSKPGNPRPRQRYYGDVGCSGLAFFPHTDDARHLVDAWAAVWNSDFARPSFALRAGGPRRPRMGPAVATRPRSRAPWPTPPTRGGAGPARCRWRCSPTAWPCGSCTGRPRRTPGRRSRYRRPSSPSTRTTSWARRRSGRGWSRWGCGTKL